jgi:hypothetical protein
MPFYTTVATIKTADNTLANFATNTWHHEADDLTALGLVHVALEAYYAAVDAAFSDLCLTTAGRTFTSYDDSDPTPRPPVLESTYAQVPGGGAPLPPEVSIVMSYQGARQAGEAQSRRRGRIYLPFLGESNNGTDGRPLAALVTLVSNAGDAHLASSVGAPSWTWVVYSPTSAAYVPVNNGWVDNEWDTQRRRGRIATSRTTFS